MTTPTFNRPDNLMQALQFNATTGQPELRVTLGSESITITGSVNVGTVVEVSSTPENPVHTHISEIGTSGVLAVPYMPSGIVDASGHINDNTHPVYVNVVNGTLAVTQSGSWNVGITGTPTVNIGTIPAVQVRNDINNPLTVQGTVIAAQGTTPWEVTGNVNATITSEPIVNFNPMMLDAFGRLRVSEPYTLFDSALRYRRNYDYSSATANGGNVTFDFDASVRKLNVTTASGSEVIRESLRVFPYQPGKSLLVMNSFVFAQTKVNLRQRVGFFGARDGIYFEQSGTTLYLVVRSSSSGTLQEERIAQAQWNGDKLNGTGASGITLNTAAPQIFWIDVEWLGVGSVRCGFIINGQYYVCHTFNHANNPAYPTTYMTTATLPIRFEITNLGTTVSNSTMQQICTTVISEGGYNQQTITSSAGLGTTTKRLTTAGVYYPMVSIRLASTNLDSIVIPRQVDILSPSVNYYRWVLLFNPTLTDATWSGVSTTGSVEYDIDATAVSGGTEVQSGYVSSRELASLGESFFEFQLGRTLAGVSDVVTLAISAVSNNADILAQMGWQQLV